MKSSEIVKLVNDRIIKLLENGTNPWIKPWNFSSLNNPNMVASKFAVNFYTKKVYEGINQILLDPGYYLTFNQVVLLKGKVKKGAKSSLVVFNETKYIPVENQEIIKQLNNINESPIRHNDRFYVFDEITHKWNQVIYVFKKFNVFKIEDTEGIDYNIEEIVIPTDSDLSFENAEAVINDYINRSKLKLEITVSNNAYYNSAKHYVRVPLKKQFNILNEFYSTLFHELSHSTGHKTLLDRPGINFDYFGDKSYSQEELVAEISASYILGYLNISTEETTLNSAAYLKSWAKNLSENKELTNVVMKSSNDGKKSFELICNLK